METIVGIAGMMRTGKTSLARMIRDEYGGRIDSFADALRQELAEALFPGDLEAIARMRYDEIEARDKSLVRPLLQTWGRFRRAQDIHYWVRRMHHKWIDSGDLKENGGLLIIDDVRHQNEVNWILEKGGFIIRLTADVPTLVERGAQPDRLSDVSETALHGMTAFEASMPHRVARIDTGGRSALGTFRALQPVLDEIIMGE